MNSFAKKHPHASTLMKFLSVYDFLKAERREPSGFLVFSRSSSDGSRRSATKVWRNFIALGILCCGWIRGFHLGTSISFAEEKKQAAPAIPMLRIAPAVPVGPIVALNQNRGDWFESWVFGGMSAENARQRLENTGSQRILLLKQHCELTDEQVSKLELAKRGDIVRFFQEVEAVRKKAGVQTPDRGNMAELGKAIAPIQGQWNTGLVSPQSLFVSVLQRILSEDQKSKLREEEERRSVEKNRVHAMSMIKMIEHSVPLTDKQRNKLLDLVVEQTKEVRVDSHLQQYISIQAATQLSDENLAEFLDASQLKGFRQLQEHWKTNLPFLNQMVKQPQNQPGEEWMDVLR